MRPISYGRQYIDESDIEEVVKVLHSDYLTQGPKVREFEKNLAEIVGAKYAVSFSNGTAALHGAYFAGGLGPKDEIVTTPNTFAATSNAALYLGARPIFSDIDMKTGNIDPDEIEEKITQRTKFIVPVHYSGHPVVLETIYKIAKKHNLMVIEDACHALGAKYKGDPIGSCKYSDMTVFSFHPVKSITTGEGGAVTTNSKELYNRLILFRQHGITKNREDFSRTPDGPWYHEMRLLGYNYRLTDIQAALGISQLRKLDKFIKRRREIVSLYKDLLKDNPYFELPPEEEYAFSSWHLYPVKLKEPYIPYKRDIFEELRKKSIFLQVHYIPVYMHPYYQDLGYKKGISPISEDFYKREISFPIYYSLEDNELRYFVDTILEIMEKLI